MKYRSYKSTFSIREASKPVKALIGIGLAVLLCILIYAGYTILREYHARNVEREQLKERIYTEKNQTTLKVTFVSLEKSWTMSMENMIENFEHEYPDINVEYETIYETGLYEDAVNRLYARDELGDIVELVEPMNYVVNDLLVPLPKVIVDQAKECFTFGENTYGIGTIGTSTGIIYNKTIFDQYELEVPTTKEEFLQACENLKENGVTPLVVGGANRWALSYLMNMYFLMNPDGYDNSWMLGLNPNNYTSRWTDPIILQTLGGLEELTANGYLEPLWSDITNDMASEYIAEGSAAMYVTSTFSIREVQFENNDANIGWTYLQNDDGEEIRDYQLHGYWAMTKQCEEDEKKYDAGVKFLQYFYSEGVYEKLCNDTTALSLINRPVKLSDTVFREAAFGERPGNPCEPERTGNVEGADSIFNLDLTNSLLPQDFRSYLFNITKRTMLGEVDAETASVMLQEEWDRIQGEHVYEDFEP